MAEFSIESLRDELKRRDQQAQLEESERRKQQSELYLHMIDTLIKLTPKHDTNNCSDEKRCEERCDRCKLLYAKEFNYWEEDHQVVLTVQILPPVEDTRAK